VTRGGPRVQRPRHARWRRAAPTPTLSLAAATVWFALAYGGAILGYLGVNAFAARLLGDDFGYFVIAVSVSTVLGQLGLFGAHRGGMREAARLRQDDEDGLLQLRLGVRVVSAVTLPLTAVLSAVATFFAIDADDRTRWSIAAGMGALVWFAGQQKLWANYLRGFGRTRFASLLEGRSGGALVAAAQGVLVGLVFLFVPGLGLPGALSAMALGFPVPVFIAWRVVSRRWRHIPAGRISLKNVRAVIKQHRHFASNMLGGAFNSYMETWIAGLVLSGASVSLFSAAQRLSLLLTIATTSLGIVFSPVISRLFERADRRRLEVLLRTGASMSAGLTAVLFVPMLVAPKPLLQAIYGASFGAAAPILVILTLGVITNVLTGMCGVALMMSRYEAIVARVQWTGVAVRIGLGATLALQFGSVGLAASAAAVSACVSVTLWYLARRRLGMWTHLTLRPDFGLMRRTAG